jgi:hypothetical protein
MSDLCRLIWCAFTGLFRPRAALEAENLVLRHQLNVLRRMTAAETLKLRLPGYPFCTDRIILKNHVLEGRAR